MKLLPTAVLAVAVILLAACAAPGADSYRDQRPVLDLRQYFDGEIEAPAARFRKVYISFVYGISVTGRNCFRPPWGGSGKVAGIRDLTDHLCYRRARTRTGHRKSCRF